MRDEAKMVEDFLNKNAFYCDRYKARITKLQCKYNCGRTMYNINMYHRKLKQLENNPSRWGNLENLFYTQLFIGKMTCKDCDYFKVPDDATLDWIEGFQKKGEFFHRIDTETECGEEDPVSACSSLGG